MPLVSPIKAKKHFYPETHSRTRHLSDDLAAVLRALPSRLKSPWVFPNASGTNRALGKLFVRRVFGPALRRAKIVDFRWKDLRHTFASRLRQRGVDIQDIRDLLGTPRSE